MKEPLIVISGPTGVGKSAISIDIAKDLGCEIVSADSVAVYRGFDIGSAKIRPEETGGIPHHLIDCLDADEPFDVVRFVEMAKSAAAEIREHGKIPLIVGGTAFYIQALVKDIPFEEEDEDTSYRNGLEKMVEEGKSGEVVAMLEEVDPESARRIHPNNIRRIIRALEFHKKNGYPICEHNDRMMNLPAAYNCAYFVLTDEREKVYAGIDSRVDIMLEQGLVEEVKGLRGSGVPADCSPMQSLGYAQINSYLDGEISYEEAVRLIKRDTRHFAKRQLTWFRREKNVIFVNKGDFDHDADRIKEYIREKALEIIEGQ
ncbi:MAG: tRNA (adenosine(37)-N6)-dimethylallyltransferase MiaA [Eubacterium sp.]|nr:tRNA (adenosine(37)-N6)-dimethylallyltransferase MiaA [Eubacterium sp.]